MKMKRKYPYQRGVRTKKRETAFLPIKGNILTISKEHILLKLIETEACLMEIANDEEEALLIAELLVTKHKLI